MNGPGPGSEPGPVLARRGVDILGPSEPFVLLAHLRFCSPGALGEPAGAAECVRDDLISASNKSCRH